MKKILIIGSGGREHALGEAVKRSTQETRLIIYGNTNNVGLIQLADRYEIGDVLNSEAIVKLAKEEEVDIAFIGPEAPIEAGVSDALILAAIPCVAPTRNTGRIETSKSFARNLFSKYDIAGNPVFRKFTSDVRMKQFIENNLGGSFVIKADGLKSGKGVFVMDDHFQTIDEGIEIAKKIIEVDGDVMIEEKFVGQEFSLMFFTDGTSIAPMPVVQDNKRAYEDDKGPNTGGMGSYSMPDHLLPFINQSDVDAATAITQSVVDALKDECEEYYKGILYGSFIKTKSGIKTIEYNARFGDPEALNVLPLLKTDFIKICDAIIRGSLHVVPVEFANFATVCKYLVPEGYPDNPVKDQKIEIEDMTDDILTYYAGVNQKEDGLHITGSRSLAMVGIDATIRKAEMLAEEGCWKVKGPVFYRKDIGKVDYLEKKVEMMENLLK